MEYYEVSLKFKVPCPRLKWFRYRVRTLLLLMLLVAIGATLWSVCGTNIYRQHLLQKLEESKVAQDAALAQWKRAVSTWRPSGQNAAANEAAARSNYFKHRTVVEDLIRKLQAEPNSIFETQSST